MADIILEDESLRDGLQFETLVVPYEEKLLIFSQLKAAGIQRIQVGSFVNPKVVPQMADTDKFVKDVLDRQRPLITGLVLSAKGLERALASGLKHISLSASVSDTHSMKNVGKPSREAVSAAALLIRTAIQAEVTVRAGVQCAFGCVYEGEIAEEKVIEALTQMAKAGAQEFNLADTTGMANPIQVKRLVSRVNDALPSARLSLHLHDTRGLGMANMIAGYEAGVRIFDTSAGGLGGCPFVKGAAGNVPTEDAVHMFESMGIKTGIDLKKICVVTDHYERILGRSLPGRLNKALKANPSRSLAVSDINARKGQNMASTKDLPLEGIRVLELGHTVMGPTCGLILADMGADVYKVERTGKGDDTRWLKGFGSGFFIGFNRNKKSISLDLKSFKGKQILLRLIRDADVLIENFGPGTVERLGVGYADCQKINPKLIYCSLKGFMPGPYERRPALDEVVQMMGGLAYMTGPTGRPLRAGASVTDIMGGSFGVIGILAALYERKVTGKGQLVQATLYEAVAFLVSQHMAVEAITGHAPPPMPERGRTWSIYDLFETADGEQVFIGVTSERHWTRLCETFKFADWAKDGKLASNQRRIQEREWFLPELQKRLRALHKRDLMALAEKAGIPFAPVNKPFDLSTDPHMIQSDSIAEVRTPAGQIAKLPKIPLRLNGKPFDLRSQPPAIGEGSFEIYRSIGLLEKEIEDLISAGVVQIDHVKSN